MHMYLCVYACAYVYISVYSYICVFVCACSHVNVHVCQVLKEKIVASGKTFVTVLLSEVFPDKLSLFHQVDA